MNTVTHVISIITFIFYHQPTKVFSETTNNDDTAHHHTPNHRKMIAPDATQFTRLTLGEIYNEMDDLASSYPDFVTVTSTQDEFDLPSSCTNFENHVGCTNRYLVIEDPLIYSDPYHGVDALKQRPDVFLSGALHGNERVGPVAMIELAKILVVAASCESGVTDLNRSTCDIFYSKYTSKNAAWLARLVSTRRIIIFPAPNAEGYHKNRRNEGLYLDPNRDFSFDNSPDQCMRSITARSINELFRKYLFQISMTYHAGIENITFEWGSVAVPNGQVSPDDKAQRILAEKMSYFAGELKRPSSSSQFYKTGDMNDILYGVRGGFEDWVYAGSWNNDLNVKCEPTTYGGYPTSKTTYDDVSLSTFNILVEISNSKNPPSSEYGSDASLLNAPFKYDGNVINGYATKHIRTALMAIDTVKPYVEINRYKKKRFDKELTPLKVLKNKWFRKKKKVVARTSNKPRVWWNVGGSFSVDETFLLYGRWSDFPWNFNKVNEVTHDELMSVLNDQSGKFSKSEIQSGHTRWSNPRTEAIPSFSARVKGLTNFSPDDSLAVFAVAKVDQNWLEQPNNVWPKNLGVQSHMVNIRTDPNYSKSKVGREVKGQLYWISVPLTIRIK